MISFEINYGALLGGARISKKRVCRIFAGVSRLFPKYKRADVSIAFVSEKEMERLNSCYHGGRGITDVLSFNDDTKGRLLGEIILHYPRAVAQGKEHRHGTMREIEILIAHGLLHLLGFDHRTKKEEERMFKIQNRL